MGLSAFVAQQAFLPPYPSTSCKGVEDIVWLSNTVHPRDDTPALYVRPDKPRRNKTLLFSHGNAEDIIQNRHLMYELAESLSCNIFAYEYSGYADTFGKCQPSESACYANADAAYKYLTEDMGIPPQNIIVFGRSLGTGPAVDLASRQACGGLILQSPLLSAVRVVTNVPGTMVFDIFANVDKIHRVTAPVLIIHGTDDRVVPFHHGKTLYKMVKGRKECLWLDGAGHNDINDRYNDRYLQSISGFLDKLED